MTPSPVLEIAQNSEELAARVASVIAARIAQVPARFSLNLSGGSTPKRIYELLGAEDLGGSIDWKKVHLFWGDERFVPMDHEDNNFRMAREAFVDKVPVPFGQVHPILTGAKTPEKAAALYAETLQNFYGSTALDPARPLFDVTLLGLGEDGHIASLFPGTAALDERGAWVTAVIGAKPEVRISLTYPALESSREIIFAVSGAKKRDILARVLANDAALPATRLATQGLIYIFADRAAMV